jgi:membrane protease YdiL (CAAX protease family)
MGLMRSLVFVALPLTVFAFGAYVVLPSLDHVGVPLPLAVLVGLGAPLLALLVAALVGYHREGRPWTWPALGDRFRLARMTGANWAWTVGLCVIMVVFPGLLSAAATAILDQAPPPDALRQMVSSDSATLMGTRLHGAWWLLPVFGLLVVLNVAGEELWWRGYVLPRQELVLGRWTWLVHGLLWTLFHTFLYWQVPGLLPGCLALSYVAVRTRSTWPGVIAHAVASVPAIVILAVGVVS